MSNKSVASHLEGLSLLGEHEREPQPRRCPQAQYGSLAGASEIQAARLSVEDEAQRLCGLQAVPLTLASGLSHVGHSVAGAAQRHPRPGKPTGQACCPESTLKRELTRSLHTGTNTPRVVILA